MRLPVLATLLAGVLCLAAAADPAERLPDPALEARARAIFADVRCLVCQNESIDDSEADLARDLRLVVRQQVSSGKSDAEIKHFLTDRYGEVVLLTPRFSIANLALWGAPFAVVVFGAGLLISRLRRGAEGDDLTADEAERIGRLSQNDSA